jgi:hypothetical protein
MGKTIALIPTHKPKFKYNLNHQIGRLQYKANLIQQLVDHLAPYGITRNEFYSDRKIPLGSKKSITSDRLMIYAQVFECTIDQLVNEPIKAKSIREVISPKRRRKTGLK